MNVRSSLIGILVTLTVLSCTKEQVSTTDSLPMPAGLEEGKDLSVKPGDSFYDYCNGTWLKNTPIPNESYVGHLVDQNDVMIERLIQLKGIVPDIGWFFELLDTPKGNDEAKTQAFLNTQKARYSQPTTKEEAFLLIGKMIADGFFIFGDVNNPDWDLTWKDGKIYGRLVPYFKEDGQQPIPSYDLDPATCVPLSSTMAGKEKSAASLILKGMGQDPSLFVTDPSIDAGWAILENKSLEELCGIIDEAWMRYEEMGHEKMSYITYVNARISVNYTLSYHLAQAFLSPAFKEKYLRIAREIQSAFRQRILRVEWMSETTKKNAIDKLDDCDIHIAYPDQWYMDAVSKLSDCTSLAEAVFRNRQGLAKLKGQLMGGKDAFTMEIINGSYSSPPEYYTYDLLLSNALYDHQGNAIIMYPALLLPPFLPENVSMAYEYAVFSIIGHEFTHGFDSQGAQEDKYGYKRNWWTVADKMAFEERRDQLADCYNHLEVDPARMPGVYGNGMKTQTEDIADLGGFLTALDAYKARLDADGYSGETYKQQLRKYYESYAYIWKSQYSDVAIKTLLENDIHSLGRLRVNGVVMNTDLWYELYGIDRNNILYLPKERRTHIW